MDLAPAHASYRYAMEILGSCFSWRADLMDRYEGAIASGDGEIVEVLAEHIEAAHQTQHRAFDMLQVMSRHHIHVLDDGNCIEMFEELNGCELDIDDENATLDALRSLADSAVCTSTESRHWLDEGLAEAKDASREELLSLVTGAVMLTISENFHEVVRKHQVLSDRMVELVRLAKDAFPGFAVVPADHIPLLNPGESERSAERTLREYTEKFLDPDMYRAYH